MSSAEGTQFSADALKPRVSLKEEQRFASVRGILRQQGLSTVCEEARCPNQGECWSSGTATFMILGDVCTRSCGFCAVATGRPDPPDSGEPERVAVAAARMGLSHVVVTSVDRDDLADGGASFFAETVRHIREKCPGAAIEILIPDFKADPGALAAVFSSLPHVLNHNIETVRRLTPSVRPQGKYDRSLSVLRQAASAGLAAKSGIMVGLGETIGEIEETLNDLAAAGCRIVTIGQYLQPSRKSLPVARFYGSDEFEEIARLGRAMGIDRVSAGPLVRSSYHAARQVEEPRLERRGFSGL